MAHGRTTDEDRRREAQRVMDRVTNETETVGTSSLARVASRARDHLAGADADANDRTEVWGRRIGRILSVIAFIGLAIWLISRLSA